MNTKNLFMNFIRKYQFYKVTFFLRDKFLELIALIFYFYLFSKQKILIRQYSCECITLRRNISIADSFESGSPWCVCAINIAVPAVIATKWFAAHVERRLSALSPFALHRLAWYSHFSNDQGVLLRSVHITRAI